MEAVKSKFAQKTKRFSCVLPMTMYEEIEETAKRLQVSESDIVRHSIRAFLNSEKRKEMEKLIEQLYKKQ
jgi:metal-responsive CopG/Arc/MetJ family transcriptional regulator